MLGKFVKIIQKDAPYNSEGRFGIVINHSNEEKEMFKVRFYFQDEETEYEAWFFEKHLKEVYDFTLEEKVEIVCGLLKDIRDERYENIVSDDPEFYKNYEDELCESITSLIDDLENTYEV